MNVGPESSTRIRYRVKRFTYTQREFDDEFHAVTKSHFSFSKFKSHLRKVRLKTFGFEIFPVFKSLMSYYNLHSFTFDVITGLTMAFFHLPQGMAYGELAGLRPINGLYTSFFPVLAYFFFTTSRHNSIGTFSLASLIFSDPINRLTSLYYTPNHPSNSTGMSTEEYDFRLKLSLTLAFCVGILQILMALLQVGFLATYLSGPLISGFMCASAFHVVASQLSSLFGIKLPRVYGPGNIFIKIYNLCARITQANIATIVICVICIILLEVFRWFINPFFRKRFKFPIPVELIMVVLGTVISHFVGFSSRWGVSIVGPIPGGLPTPVVPTFAYFSDLVPDIFVNAIVTFTINAGLVKTYASEFGYDVLDNQELLALGISNTFGSFFRCHTACGALGRTAVVVSIGMTSQIASLISCGLFLLILFFIAPYLESLPQAILACIICVALTSTFKKFMDLKRLWKLSKVDASVWLVSFLTTFAVDIIYGIAIGFVYSILTVVSRSQYGGRFLLGEAKKTDLFSEIKCFEELRELEGIKIIRYDGPVYFASVDSFQKTIYSLSGVNPVKALQKLNGRVGKCKFFSLLKKKSPAHDVIATEPIGEKANLDEEAIHPGQSEIVKRGSRVEIVEKPLRYIILDASGWMFTDTVGLCGIKRMIKKYSELDINIFVVALRPRLREMFADSGVFAVLPEENVFVSLYDAVLVALDELQSADAGTTEVVEDEIEATGFPRRDGGTRRRRRTTVKSLDNVETDPDTTTDFSVMGEEKVTAF